MCFNNSHQHPGNLTIGDKPVSFVMEAKVLGLWIQNNLKWDKHMLTKANRKLFMLRSLKRVGFSLEELRIVFNGYVRPVLEYGDVIWHSSITAKHTHTVESIQKRACKIILDNSYNSYESACLSLGLDSLAGRRGAHCRRFADGLVDNPRTKDLLPPPSSLLPPPSSLLPSSLLPSSSLLLPPPSSLLLLPPPSSLLPPPSSLLPPPSSLLPPPSSLLPPPSSLPPSSLLPPPSYQA